MAGLMGRDDWFRNEKWDAATEARFFEKLCRARDKAQPLRIQALYLVERHPEVALALLDRYFALGDNFDKAQAFEHQAEAYLVLGKQEEALQSLKNALRRERDFPNSLTQAWSVYAMLVAEKKLEHLYDDAMEVLRQYALRPLAFSLPVDGFLWNAACALIAHAQGLDRDAAECAAKALEFAELPHSGFRYHSKVGLVASKHSTLKNKLRSLVRS